MQSNTGNIAEGNLGILHCLHYIPWGRLQQADFEGWQRKQRAGGYWGEKCRKLNS